MNLGQYPLAPLPIYWTINGEAHLRGFQMAFLRLAGCSVGCPNCDTDYRRDSTASAEQIANMVEETTVTIRATSATAQQLEGIANNLKRQVGKFTV